ncbi:bifunctional metallophosphatase/5'-nucleotidase [Undibacterium squillarum]|uniref:Multifunctional 2',3'-cyclic-nucleotide 2'-phosphodiesterase/5'-nucleotidase/3'-nucleotidase n=1 Tax=Undibacterium squillarum TaxID=1131567 RepID=A0ABQ2XWN4_9BURK|nr:bifunctional metallophosphatase/5'-nucleotidase [Undibacterium squillarum]GGX38172.1 multifunctional 2',3'-cyclic-nucleotide 2'-phosphodiesterase/5'-nucleotidase/3'-nucleotidase [Undibacterium squillarum]
MKLRPLFLSPLLAAALQLGVTASALAETLRTVTIFSINDFHGNLQASQPVPYQFPRMQDGKAVNGAAGGYAYLVTKLKERRAAVGDSILVGAGDLMGASPMGSALLKDEPVVEALNRMQLNITAVGNHEFDNGTADLMRRIQGTCPEAGCAFQGFKGASYAYLGANVIDKSTGKPWLTPYVVRQVGDLKIGFIGAVTADVPNLVAGDAVKALRFDDEAETINRYVPELKAQGVDAIVVLIHEGAMFKGPESDPTYQCEGLQGPIINIANKIDPAVSLIVSGHSHQGYTCKIGDKLVVQGRSYGAYLTESTLTVDKDSRKVVKADAVNHLIDQQNITPDAEAQTLVAEVARLTGDLRSRPVIKLSKPLLRFSEGDAFDSSLGNLIADSQLHFAQHMADADIAFMNSGGIRNDLPSGAQGSDIQVTFGDLYAVQPFGNGLVRLKMTGQQILDVLQQQWKNRPAGEVKKLFVSQGFSYVWQRNPAADPTLRDVQVNGKALDPEHTYTVIVNSFLAEGGDGFTVFKKAGDRALLGRDLDAMESYIREHSKQIDSIATDRVHYQ